MQACGGLACGHQGGQGQAGCIPEGSQAAQEDPQDATGTVLPSQHIVASKYANCQGFSVCAHGSLPVLYIVRSATSRKYVTLVCDLRWMNGCCRSWRHSRVWGHSQHTVKLPESCRHSWIFYRRSVTRCGMTSRSPASHCSTARSRVSASCPAAYLLLKRSNDQQAVDIAN